MTTAMRLGIRAPGGEVADALPHPCSACPWRISNQGTEHPHGFYDKANIKRLWDGLRRGDAPGMSCHPTDSRMAEYEGYEETAERETMHECAGSLIVLARELQRFQMFCLEVEAEERATGTKLRSGEALRRYRQQAGRSGMTREGLAAITWLVVTGQTKLPGDADRVNDPDIGCALLPAWDPAIRERAQQR